MYPPYGPFDFSAYGPGPYQRPYTAEQERDFLQNQAGAVEEQLKEIRKRITELETEMEQENKEAKEKKQ